MIVVLFGWLFSGLPLCFVSVTLLCFSRWPFLCFCDGSVLFPLWPLCFSGHLGVLVVCRCVAVVFRSVSVIIVSVTVVFQWPSLFFSGHHCVSVSGMPLRPVFQLVAIVVL